MCCEAIKQTNKQTNNRIHKQFTCDLKARSPSRWIRPSKRVHNHVGCVQRGLAGRANLQQGDSKQRAPQSQQVQATSDACVQPWVASKFRKGTEASLDTQPPMWRVRLRHVPGQVVEGGDRASQPQAVTTRVLRRHLRLADGKRAVSGRGLDETAAAVSEHPVARNLNVQLEHVTSWRRHRNTTRIQRPRILGTNRLTCQPHATITYADTKATSSTLHAYRSHRHR